MRRIFTSTEKSFKDISHVAIAIKGINDRQRHIGLLHRGGEDRNVNLLHFAWHKDLRNESPHADYLWVDLNVHPSRARQVAAICRQIWKANGKDRIPYGFSPPNGCFDKKTAEYLLGPTRLGLTCATFVLAVFHRAGLPLIVYESWPRRREKDNEWAESILQALQRNDSADSEHLLAISEQGCAVRYRPEEVAAAGTQEPPIEYPVAEKVAAQILVKIYE